VDQTLNPEAEKSSVCASCSSPEVLNDYPVKLCANCRNHFIKYPIPIWVRLFGAGVVLLMLISMLWLPKNFHAAIALSRAEKAEKTRNYITEENELRDAIKAAPNSLQILSHLAIASFYNNNFTTLDSVLDKLKGKNLDDTSLVNRVNDVIESSKSFMPTAVYDSSFVRYKNKVIPDTALIRYIRQHSTDTYASLILASSYVDQEKYGSADTILTHALDVDPKFLPALEIKGMLKREINQIDSSLYYCDKVLAINNQSLYALSSKARTILKSGNHVEGLKIANLVFKLNSHFQYNLATLAIAYHLNQDFKKRDAILGLAAKDSVLASYLTYVKDVISGKVVYK